MLRIALQSPHCGGGGGGGPQSIRIPVSRRLLRMPVTCMSNGGLVTGTSGRNMTDLEEFIRQKASEASLEAEVVDFVVNMLRKEGLKTLGDVQASLTFKDMIRLGIPGVLCARFKDFVMPSTPGDELDMSNKMAIHFRWRTATLKEENRIEQLPYPYEPEFDFSSDQNEPFSLNLLDFGESLVLNSIWGLKRGGYPQVVLERKCYRFLWNMIMAGDGRRAILMLGPPGVGKTGFLLYVLARLMENNQRIFFRCQGGECFLYEPAAFGYRCTEQTGYSALKDASVYFLADGQLPLPPVFFGLAILTSIPLEVNFKEYDKDGAGMRLYMPVWSADEIALGYQEVFSNLSNNVKEYAPGAIKLDPDMIHKVAPAIRRKQALTIDVVRDRYRKWGGSARFVLEQTEADLDMIIRNVGSIQATVEAVGKEVADGDHPSHKLVHMKVHTYYTSMEYMFATPYVLAAAYQKLQETESGALRAFVRFKGLAVHGLDCLKGPVAQYFFKNNAVNTKKFKIRLLHKNEACKKKEPEVEMAFHFGLPVSNFSNLDRLQIPLDRYRMFWPLLPIQKTFDGFAIRKADGGDILEVFQVTKFRNKHQLNYQGIFDVMEKVGIPPSRTIVYIVTTDELFDDAGYQSWMESHNQTLKNKSILKELEPIQQYALNSGM